MIRKIRVICVECGLYRAPLTPSCPRCGHGAGVTAKVVAK